jgi:glycosyltransferase involved in cell wall biosynthesis
MIAQMEPMYSVVAPVFNEEESLPKFYERVTAVMEELGQSFELILVDDGSRDASAAIMRRLHEQDPRVRAILLSRNFGHQIVISAGMDYARGRAVVIIDADLQDPPEVIKDLVARWHEGYEVVYAQRAERHGESAFKLLTAKFFYRMIRRLTAIDIPPDTGDFRLLDRKVVDVMKRMREHTRFMRGLSIWVGFRRIGVTYVRHERYTGTTKYPLRKMLRFAWDGVTSFSYVPLQLATSFGFAVAGLSLLGILVAIVARLFGNAVSGQATTLVAVLFLGGVQLIFLGMIGEYLGRIYDEVRNRPLYIVREVLEDAAPQSRSQFPASSDQTV